MIWNFLQWQLLQWLSDIGGSPLIFESTSTFWAKILNCQVEQFFQILCPILLSHISSQYCQLYFVPSPVAVAVAEDNRRQDNSHHTQREDHLEYHFGTFWGPIEPLWIVEYHRLNWFWPGALIYTWLRQSLAKWTCHPAPALPSHPLVWRQDTLGEASTTALADLVRVPGWRYSPLLLMCCSLIEWLGRSFYVID